MNITDVKIKKTEGQGKMLAVASITIDEVFVIHDIKLINGAKGMFVAMPSKRQPDGGYKDIAHPINTESRNEIQDAVIEAYNNIK